LTVISGLGDVLGDRSERSLSTERLAGRDRAGWTGVARSGVVISGASRSTSRSSTSAMAAEI